ncbi:MAG TPA: sulfotransferase domain-containing protein [Gammaproteobacteria bacterium]|nr:sulfotransferase domain-containing protein [Gammaproteobacteria bacterium]
MSKLAVFVFSIVFYGVIVPSNWLLTRLGFEPLLVTLMTRAQSGGRFDKVFAGYKPTASDVFVSTFAKSGTNWMMQIAHQIAFRGAGDYAHIHDVVSWPDMSRRRGRLMSVPLDDQRVQSASPTRLRVIKTHLAARYLPYDESARYLVVVRDPKEILVSSYHFTRGVAGPLMPPPDVWLELFLTRRFPLNFGSTWAEHTAGYWALKDRPNVLVLLFQDMKRDLPGAVQQVADVLGVRLTNAELRSVIEQSTFSYMSGIEHKFTPIPKGALPWGEGLKMMRRGQSGSSSELLTPEQQERIDAHFEEELGRLGSDFPYARLFAARSALQAPDFNPAAAPPPA